MVPWPTAVGDALAGEDHSFTLDGSSQSRLNILKTCGPGNTAATLRAHRNLHDRGFKVHPAALRPTSNRGAPRTAEGAHGRQHLIHDISTGLPPTLIRLDRAPSPTDTFTLS